MISLEYLWIGLGVIAFILLISQIRRIRKRRVWMSYKKNRYCYMDVDENGGLVFPITGGGKSDILGQVKILEISDDDEDVAEIWVTKPDDSGLGKKESIFVGKVNSKGEIYKGRSSKIYGYTANPDQPEFASVESRWRKLWGMIDWYRELDVYIGEPKPAPKPETEDEEKEEIVVPPAVGGDENQPAETAPVENPLPEVPEPKPEPEPKQNDSPALNADASKKKNPPKRVAKCEIFRYPSPGKDEKIPDVVRAAAFMLLYRDFAKDRNRETLTELPYGWRDTAFVSMIIFVLIYLVFYSVYCAVLEMPFIGQSYEMGLTMACFYFVVWAIVRQLKIAGIESGNSFQPQLDLLNSRVGIGWITFVIGFFSILSIVVSIANGENNFELLPLQVVVLFGLIVNYFQRGEGISERWTIEDSYDKKKPEDEEETESKRVEPPAGTIQKTYEWELGSRTKKECFGQVAMSFDQKELARLRQANPFYSQRVDLPMGEYVKKMFNYLTENPDAMHRTRWIAQCIQDQGRRLEKGDFYQFVLDFVQEPNIKFCADQDSKSIDYAVHYMRFPDETLYDKEGDADCKAFLAAMIFHALGYNVLFMHSQTKKHTVIGVEPRHNWYEEFFNRFDDVKLDDVFVTEGGHRYILCECTGDDFFVGSTVGGVKLVDYETKIRLPQNKDADSVEEDYCKYEWKYKDEPCVFELKFARKDIAALRDENPFAYSSNNEQDSIDILQEYKSRLPSMLKYFTKKKHEDARSMNVMRFCEHVRKQSEIKKFSDLESLQYALSFVSSAITHSVDKDSNTILSIMEKTRLKDYVRYPDEILYDQEGDCDCKAFLAAMIFRYMGYSSVYLASSVHEHAAIAVEFKEEWASLLNGVDLEKTILVVNDKKYIYCETTDGSIGQLGDKNINKFEVILEIPGKVTEESK